MLHVKYASQSWPPHVVLRITFVIVKFRRFTLNLTSGMIKYYLILRLQAVLSQLLNVSPDQEYVFDKYASRILTITE